MGDISTSLLSPPHLTLPTSVTLPPCHPAYSVILRERSSLAPPARAGVRLPRTRLPLRVKDLLP